MSSRRQRAIARALRVSLTGVPVGGSILEAGPFREVIPQLEMLIPAVLRAASPDWRHESLDGVYPLRAVKLTEDEVEVFGYCILITSQRYTPFHATIRLDREDEAFAAFACGVGERGPGGMILTRYADLTRLQKRLHALQGQSGRIEWAYEAGFGPRRDD